jgi:hypothetical protein
MSIKKSPNNTANIVRTREKHLMLVFKSSLQIYEKRSEKRNHDASVNEIYVCGGIFIDHNHELCQ